MTPKAPRAGGRVADISLPRLLRVNSLPSPSAVDVTSWFARPAPSRVDLGTLKPLLNSWLAGVDRPTAEERGPIVKLLRSSGETGTPFTYNVLFREEHGGRRYAYWVEGYDGRLVLSRNGHKELRHPRALLQSSPNALRPAILSLPGHLLILADIDRCFLAIAAALTRDAKLREDLEGDAHQRVGDAFVPGLAAALRRAVGKVLNNALVGGVTPYGLQEHLAAGRHPVTFDEAERLHQRWWARYSAFRDSMMAVRRAIRRQVAAGLGLTIRAPDGHIFRFSPAELSGSAWGTGRYPEADQVMAEGSAVSSLWRAIEGSAVDRALALLQPLKAETGLRLVLTMYDGLVLAVPEARAEEGAELVKACLVQAFRECGVEVGVDIKVQPRWGVLP